MHQGINDFMAAVATAAEETFPRPRGRRETFCQRAIARAIAAGARDLKLKKSTRGFVPQEVGGTYYSNWVFELGTAPSLDFQASDELASDLYFGRGRSNADVSIEGLMMSIYCEQ